MSKLSKDEYLGPTNGLIVAVLLPLGYGVYEFVKTKVVHFVAMSAANARCLHNELLVSAQKGSAPLEMQLPLLPTQRTCSP